MTRPAHLARAPGKRRKAASTTASAYPPGHFLELVRLHNWPPRFEPQIHRINTVYANGMTPSENSHASRERGLAEGRWSATGTIPMRGTPKDSGPKGWL